MLSLLCRLCKVPPTQICFFILNNAAKVELHYGRTENSEMRIRILNSQKDPCPNPFAIFLKGLLILIPNAGETAPYYATSFTEIMFHVSTRSVPFVNKIKVWCFVQLIMFQNSYANKVSSVC
jgi:hypothetical protein